MYMNVIHMLFAQYIYSIITKYNIYNNYVIFRTDIYDFKKREVH
jgi:hypothetical protein